MDLSSMSAKLNSGLYKDRTGFEADFRLMINNSKTYNPQGTYVHGEAVGLEQFFDKRQPRQRLSLTFSIADILIRMGSYQQNRRVAQERTPFHAPSSSSPCNPYGESRQG